MCCALSIWPSNCTPDPVPKSKTDCTGVVGVVRNSERLAAPTPNTCSGPGTWSTTEASTSEKTHRLAPSMTCERISSAIRTTPLALVCAMLASTSFVAKTEPTAFANSVAGMGSCNKNNLMSKSIWVPRPVATSTAAGSPRYKRSEERRVGKEGATARLIGTAEKRQAASSRWLQLTRAENTPLLLLFFQAEDGIRDGHVTGVQTCALPISLWPKPNLLPLLIL